MLLAPIVPHVASVLWQALGHTDDIIEAVWPRPDANAMVREEIEIVVQVNGKKRAVIQVPADAGKADCEAAAMADDNVKRFTSEKTIRKIVVVPGKLVNVVVSA